jgi:Mn-dependent DtxR family transcriptional regulator
MRPRKFQTRRAHSIENTFYREHILYETSEISDEARAVSSTLASSDVCTLSASEVSDVSVYILYK